MPSPPLLKVILAVKHERGYGVFVGPVLCDAWANLSSSTTTPPPKFACFSFKGPNDTPWQGIFASLAYQGRVKRKKQGTHFVIDALPHELISRTVGFIPFCPASISSLPFLPKASDGTAR